LQQQQPQQQQLLLLFVSRWSLRQGRQQTPATVQQQMAVMMLQLCLARCMLAC
jgi:hypothetical protein